MADHLDERDALIDRYLDAELPDSEAARFFSSLANDADLRRDFGHALRIREALRGDIPTPPARMRRTVFTAAGLAAAPEPVPLAAPFATSWRAWLRGALLLSLGGAVTFLALRLTASINRHTSTAPVIESPVPRSPLIPEKAPIVLHDSVAARTREAIPSGHAAGGAYRRADSDMHLRAGGTWRATPAPVFETPGTPSAGMDETRPVAMLDTSASNRSQTDATVTRSHLPDTFHPATLADSNTSTSHSKAAIDAPGERAVQPTARTDESRSSRVHLQLRGFAMASWPRLDLPGLITPPLNNVALAILYEIGDGAVGVEAGQENFLQQYTLHASGGEQRIDQNWLGVWLGVAYEQRVSIASLPPWLAPVARVVAGGTELGPTARASLGMRATLSQRLSVMAAAEGSALLYRVDGRSYTTRKAGITAGVDIRF